MSDIVLVEVKGKVNTKHALLERNLKGGLYDMLTEDGFFDLEITVIGDEQKKLVAEIKARGRELEDLRKSVTVVHERMLETEDVEGLKGILNCVNDEIDGLEAELSESKKG